MGAAWFKTANAPTTRLRRRYRPPCLEMGPNRCLPPVESSRETMPIQAAKSRRFLKIEASGTVATMALVPRTPMPGMVSSRLLSAFLRCCARRHLSIAAIAPCQEQICATSADRPVRALSGRRASLVSATIEFAFLLLAHWEALDRL